jgi:hypothetical protein
LTLRKATQVDEEHNKAKELLTLPTWRRPTKGFSRSSRRKTFFTSPSLEREKFIFGKCLPFCISVQMI